MVNVGWMLDSCCPSIVALMWFSIGNLSGDKNDLAVQVFNLKEFGKQVITVQY